MRRWVVVVTVLAVVFTLTGCRRSRKKESEEEAADRIVSRAVSLASGKKTEVNVSGDTVQFKDAEGTLTVNAGEGAKLPDTFPKDIPVYKPASVMQSASRNENEFSVALQSKDDVEKIASFYTEGMAAEGWDAGQQMNMPNRSIHSYQKGKRMIHLMIFKGEDETVITIGGGLDT